MRKDNIIIYRYLCTIASSISYDQRYSFYVPTILHFK